jgi:predicted metal-dependent peptidase
MGETQGILNAYPQIKGNLFFADANLYGPYPFSIDAPIPEAKGGGGTSFEPFFEWISRKSGTLLLCIYFTDGYGSFPNRLADANVLWLVLPSGLESNKFPFGMVARLG